ncbi:MAG TPA: class I SAM-dependent methyltransferase [Jatrophihabitans sp.]|jgi:SAM-dependent methyltransferase|uniref:class I SAM-dependent methyltransferase n=1 Tax=Jatrophihabitans sp. TaxID=1932789 RepID=UPI002DFFCEDE|nr:class I SAM-dependent methyltransferase [Jatrophihabitans sp.]
MTERPRWFTEHDERHSAGYVARFRRMAADGADLVGEARLVDVLVGRAARILDAGCGPGRVGAELHARGHDVVGVDVDPVLIEAARADHPGPRWELADLASLDLDGPPFDAAVLAGNVLVYVAPGSERQVLARVSAHVRPGGVIVLGFATDREYGVAELDADVTALGLTVEHRFATWDLHPWTADVPWAVSIVRLPR